ncbi:peptidase S8/S53 domain-containing protein [Lasiosphaeris hirsuta]|uniref:Peptidase S8/S53 domain-containing protein n=1 Tax=Lasiosphaeris hirsuta TaxID=260670 RepID=A0AA40B0R0_9PEZI|nr:peptidase S8/S53 domain-containing protein [Lasiosphaeris hirsuta]
MKLTSTIASLVALIAIPFAFAEAPIKNAGVSKDLVVPDRYIVIYKQKADPALREKHEQDIDKKGKNAKKGGVVNKLDLGDLHGYIAEIPASTLKDVVASDLASIDFVELDTIVRVSPIKLEDDKIVEKRAFETQANGPWGLARISHRSPGFSDYVYDNSGGEGIRVYVVDTGIMTNHTDFEGRAIHGMNFALGTPNTDENGHGTHVAGTIGGKTYGVAKKATLVSVKVLDASGAGTFAAVMEGIAWAVLNAQANGGANKAVINVSLGGGNNGLLNTIVDIASGFGATVVAAAGNDNDDAANHSPASALSAITVGALDQADSRAYFSNFGRLVNIFAPGVGVLSACLSAVSNSESCSYSGTSMAAPHISGLAAYYIKLCGLAGSTAVTNKIIETATMNTLGDSQGSPRRIAYNLATGP